MRLNLTQIIKFFNNLNNEGTFKNNNNYKHIKEPKKLGSFFIYLNITNKIDIYKLLIYKGFIITIKIVIGGFTPLNSILYKDLFF